MPASNSLCLLILMRKSLWSAAVKCWHPLPPTLCHINRFVENTTGHGKQWNRTNYDGCDGCWNCDIWELGKNLKISPILLFLLEKQPKSTGKKKNVLKGIGNDLLMNACCQNLCTGYLITLCCQACMGMTLMFLVRKMKHKELELFMKDTNPVSDRIKM